MIRFMLSIGLATVAMSSSEIAAQTPGAPAAPEKPAVGTSAPQAASSYRISAGDELEIYVWGEERLQRKVKVLPDGTIAFPLVGQIKVQGYLPSEVEAAITSGLSAQYVGAVPQVTVSVVAPAGMQFSVMGRVKAPGTFTPGRYVNILEALSMAGGPGEFANLDNVLIIRKSGEQLTTLTARLAPLFKPGTDTKDVERANILRIETGDTVIVR